MLLSAFCWDGPAAPVGVRGRPEAPTCVIGCQRLASGCGYTSARAGTARADMR